MSRPIQITINNNNTDSTGHGPIDGHRSSLLSEFAMAVIHLPTYARLAVSLSSLHETSGGTRSMHRFYYDSDDLSAPRQSILNRYKSVLAWRKICHQLRTNARHEVAVHSHRLTPKAIQRLVRTLPHATTLERLALDEMDLRNEGLGHICEALKELLENQQQENLCDGGNDEEHETATVTLRELSLQWNCISSIGLPTLLNLLMCPAARKVSVGPGTPDTPSATTFLPTVQVLNLTGNALGYFGAHVLAKALPSCTSLLELQISDCNLSNNGVKILSGAIPLTTLKVLYLDRNGINNDGAFALAHGLKSRYTPNTGMPLTSSSSSFYGSHRQLSGSSSSIGGSGGGDQSRFTTSPLEVLSLAGNQIEWGGARELLEVAALPNTKLQTLMLGANYIVYPGTFTAGMTTTTVTGLSPRDRSWLRAATLSTATTFHLQRLVLNFNHVGDEGAKSLARLLLQPQLNGWLQELELSGARIGNEGAMALAQAVEHNVVLRRLTLDHNSGIGWEAREMFAQILKTTNQTLSELTLDDDDLRDNSSRRGSLGSTCSSSSSHQSDSSKPDCLSSPTSIKSRLQPGRRRRRHQQELLQLEREQHHNNLLNVCELSFFLHLNARGRKLLCNPSCPSGLVPHLLEHPCPSVVYAFLKYRPDVVMVAVQGSRVSHGSSR